MQPISSLDKIKNCHPRWKFKVVCLWTWHSEEFSYYYLNVWLFLGKAIHSCQGHFPLVCFKGWFFFKRKWSLWIKMFTTDMLSPPKIYCQLNPHCYLGSCSSPDFGPDFSANATVSTSSQLKQWFVQYVRVVLRVTVTPNVVMVVKVSTGKWW